MLLSYRTRLRGPQRRLRSRAPVYERFSNQDQLIQTFNDNGSIIVPNVLDNNDCNSILDIMKEEEQSENVSYGNINSKYKRKDLMLPLEKMKPFIKKIQDKIDPFCDIIIPDGEIVECSSIISYPGCYPQIWHSDTQYESDNDGTLVTFGIVLDDITHDMGPLEVYLKSNKFYKNDTDLYIPDSYEFKPPEPGVPLGADEGLKKQNREEYCKKLNLQKVSCNCKKGSLVVWSSTVIHRGSGNTSNKERPVFYFSLLGKGDRPEGTTYSIKN